MWLWMDRTDLGDLQSFFNWSMGYRRDADFPVPYGALQQVNNHLMLQFLGFICLSIHVCRPQIGFLRLNTKMSSHAQIHGGWCVVVELVSTTLSILRERLI